MMILSRCAPLLTVALVMGAFATSCGADGNATLDLSPEGQQGREIADRRGCDSCHGVDGEGRVGPKFVGLYGSTVQLADGTTVVADDAYLREAIVDPNARKVDGYGLTMPAADLPDEEIDAIIAFIRDLSPDAAPATSGATEAGE